MAIWGYDKQLWDRAFHEGLNILTERASRRNPTISYSELAGLMHSIRFNAEDTAFHALLGEISVAESEAGRGMLSVLVIHKTGDMMPGRGFFELARELGRDVRDEVSFWAKEFCAVQEAHSS